MTRQTFWQAVVLCGLMIPEGRAEPVTVRHREGVTHGFLTLETLEKGEHLVDVEPVHNNYASIEYRMGNIRKVKVTIQQPAKP